MDQRLSALALVKRLTPAEMEALRNLAAGGSLRDLARRLSTDIANATETMDSMKLKLGAVKDVEAVRVALYAGVGLHPRAL